MRWVVEPDARAYADRVLPWLAREPVRTTVPATILVGVLDRVYAQAWLARGEVVLFADRANPTATGVYRRIGFRPVAEWDDWTLEY